MHGPEPEPHFEWAKATVNQHSTINKLNLQVPLKAAHDVAERFQAHATPDENAAYTSIEVARHGGAYDYMAYVGGVRTGREAELRDHLERVLASVRPEVEEQRAEEEHRKSEREQRDTTAERMTETFRSFAEE